MYPWYCYLGYSNDGGVTWEDLICDTFEWDMRNEVVRRQGRTLRLRSYDHKLGTVRQITARIRPSFAKMHRSFFLAFHAANLRRTKLRSADDWINVTLPGGIEPFEYLEGLQTMPVVTLQMTEVL